MIPVSLQQRQFLGLLFPYQASSSNTQNYLQIFFSMSRASSHWFLRPSFTSRTSSASASASVASPPERGIHVCTDDASKPPLSPLYRGPYKVLRRSEKFFVPQIRDKSDSVSVDRLKPVTSATPVTPAVHPPRGHLVLASITRPPDPVSLPVKKVRFEVRVPATKLRQNPHWTVQGPPPLSAILRPHLLGGVLCGYYDNLFFVFSSHSSWSLTESFSGKAQG